MTTTLLLMENVQNPANSRGVPDSFNKLTVQFVKSPVGSLPNRVLVIHTNWMSHAGGVPLETMLAMLDDVRKWLDDRHNV